MKVPGITDLQRIYFAFGEPIRTSHYNRNFENVKFCEEVRPARPRLPLICACPLLSSFLWAVQSHFIALC